MDWIKNNWDKIIIVIIIVIVAGVIGFYSGIFTIHSRLNELEKKVVAINVEIRRSVRPKIEEVDKNKGEINAIMTKLLIFEINFKNLEKDVSYQSKKIFQSGKTP